MKTLKTLFFGLVIFLALLSSSEEAKSQFYPNTYRAESDWQINVGGEGMYSLTPARKPGIGASFGVRRFVENSVSLRATIAYKLLQDQRRSADFKYFSGLIGAMAYVTPNFYVSGDGGFAKSNKILPTRATLWLMVSPGVGYSFPNNGLDVGLNYDLLHRNGDYVAAFGVKVSYNFNLSSY